MRLDRRLFTKLFGVSLFAPLLGTTKIDKQKTICVVGGGVAGLNLISKLSVVLFGYKIILIESNELSPSIQTLLTSLAVGEIQKHELFIKIDDMLIDNIELIKERVVKFDPQNNTLFTKSKTLKYDYLVLATGVCLNYHEIEGLEISYPIATFQTTTFASYLLANNISSIYFLNGAIAHHYLLKSQKKQARKRAITLIFTRPNTPIKCGSASIDILLQSYEYLKKYALKNRVSFIYATASTKLYGVDEYDKLAMELFAKIGVKIFFETDLKRVDVENKQAIFLDKNRHETIIRYDILHITPPMSAPSEIKDSLLGSKSGWIDVNEETLRHKRFDNVFALGDVAQTHYGKTAMSAVSQATSVAQNLLDLLHNRKMSSIYSGYSSCFLTNDKKSLLLEYNYLNISEKKYGSDDKMWSSLWHQFRIKGFKIFMKYFVYKGLV